MTRPCLLAALCLSLVSTGVTAQDDSGGSGGAAESNDLDSKYVLPGFDFAVVIHPQRAWNTKPAQAVQNRNPWADFVDDESGLDVRTMQRILSLSKIPSPGEDGRPPRWDIPANVIWTTEPIDVEKFVEESPLDEKNPLEHRGVKYWQSRGNPARQPAAAFPNPKTMLFAKPEVLVALIDAHLSNDDPPPSPLSKRLEEADLDADLVFVAEVDDADRKVMQAAFASNSQQLPPNLKLLVEALIRTKGGVTRVDLSDESMIRTSLEVDAEGAAEQLETQTREGIKGITQLLEALKAFSDDPKTTEFMALAAGVLGGTEVEREGTTVRVTMPPPADWSPITTALDEEISKMLERERRRLERRKSANDKF